MVGEKRYSSLRFSRRLRNRETNKYESIDTRKSADQFQQNEFLKLFELKCSSMDRSLSSVSNVQCSTESSNSSIDCCPLSPTADEPMHKRMRIENPKPYAQHSVDVMSIDTFTALMHLQTTTIEAFGKHRVAEPTEKTLCLTNQFFYADKQLYELYVMENIVLQRKNQSLQNKRLCLLKEDIYRRNVRDLHKRINEQLMEKLQILQQKLQLVMS